MMFLSTSRIALALALASSVFAAPSGFRSPHSSQSSSSSGAAYFITNDPSGNQIIAMNIASNGKLSGVSAVSAGGRGAHGISNPIGPDPLFSQGAIKASAAAKMLVTVNPGSNTLSMFAINPNNPTKLTMVGSPVSSEGEFPMSVAINAKGSMVCVLNGGTVNGVNCYTPDSKLGLIAKPNTLRSLGLNQTTPATGPAGTTSHIVFSEDGSKLIASVKGVPPTPGFLAAWDIAADGSLSAEPVKSTPAAGGLLPFSMTVIPGTNAILATDAGVGFDIFDFGSGGNGTSSGDSASSSVVPIDGQSATCWSSFSSKSGNFYLTDIGTATVTEVNVSKNLTGSIVKQYPQAKGSATIDNDVATVGKNNFLYVLAANATTVNVLSVNTPGKATPVQNFNFASAAKAAGIKFGM
uniref:3-carboxymuconate cyclase n=1 Tax=Psilocybe cubensis TaxID=181762 RepID=A0A8H7Y8Z6_PSICU